MTVLGSTCKCGHCYTYQYFWLRRKVFFTNIKDAAVVSYRGEFRYNSRLSVTATTRA